MLFVCATPIGNLGDITLRVLDALRSVEIIAAEDTRRTRKLLAHYDIHTTLTSFYAHNENQKTQYVLGLLLEGRDVALVTDAGLPGVSDPGGRLIAAAITRDIEITVLPGASAPATALVASGLLSENGFCFVGYLPRRSRELRDAWRRWERCGGVLVAFETPQRLIRSLNELATLAPAIPGAVCRELTKLHEEVVRGTLSELAARFGSMTDEVGSHETVRGELTLVFDLGVPAGDRRVAAADASEVADSLLQRGLSRRDVAHALHLCLGVPHREAVSLVRAIGGESPSANRRRQRRGKSALV